MYANATSDDKLDPAMEEFAAELTEAAYPVLMRSAPVKNWLDMELELWRTMRQKVGQWAQDWPQAGVVFVPALDQE
jgi:hypothetical protein